MARKYEIDYNGAPTRSEAELLSLFSEDTILCLDDVLASKEAWYVTYQSILDILKYGYERYEIRHRKIMFRIHTGDTKIHSLELRHFLGNLNLWYAFLEADAVDIMDETFILSFEYHKYSDIIDYIDNKIFGILDIDINTKGKIADEITYNISATARAFEDILGLGFSVYNLIKTAEEFPIIDKILHEHIDTSLQPAEIESILSDRTDKLVEAIRLAKNCDLRPLIVAGKNMSKGQFKEIAVRIGMKSDISGNVIPYVADCNLIVDGLKTPGAYYISAKSGRKSSVFSKLCMGEPGAFSKKVCINSTSAQLRKDYTMCDSDVPVTYTIEDETFLKMLDKRYYYDDSYNLKLLNANEDKDLIGKAIKFRSPCTCTSTEGVCKYCYGELYEVNKDLFSAGCYAATKETEYLGQAVLSTKHEQQTSSTPIEFNEDFNKDFEIVSTSVMLSNDDDEGTDDSKFILFGQVFEDNDDEDVNRLYVEEFFIVDANAEVLYEVKEETGLKLFMTDATREVYDRYKGKKHKEIPLSEFDASEGGSGEPIFEVEIKSAETTEPTKLLKSLLNNKDKGSPSGEYDTIDAICQRFADLKIKAGHPYNCVHHEMIIRNMIRKKSNKFEFPDFSPTGDHNDYQILRIDDALYNSPSPFISLTHGHLSKQLLSPQFYKKEAPSHLDPLFAPVLADIILDN